MTVRAADVEALARTVYGEARGEPREGQIAVAYVALNRLADERVWWEREEDDGVPDGTIEAVVEDPHQFSAWNGDNPTRGAMLAATLDDMAYREAMLAALTAIQGRDSDPTGGATHYHSVDVTPAWAEGARGKRIGRHIFYRL